MSRTAVCRDLPGRGERGPGRNRVRPRRDRHAPQGPGASPAGTAARPAGSGSPRRWLAPAAVALAALLLPALLPAGLLAREDSARLVLKKSAGPRKTRLYVVKKGEFITGIFRSQLGDEPVPIALIRQLNPEIRNLNRIYPGQQIVLPIRETTDEPASVPGEDRKAKAPLRQYTIQEGDSISRIILTELEVAPENVLVTYRQLRRLNPDITDLGQLTAGQLLNLPPGPVRADRPTAEPLPTVVLPPEPPPPAVPVQTAALPPEPAPAEQPDKVAPVTERQLGIIRPIISRMKGSLTSAGSYFIPLRDNAQVTIDCSLIPVVELDDGSTMLLDFGNRLSPSLKALISQAWTNYGFLAADELGDDLSALQGIIRRSRNYTMSRVNTPLTLTAKPEVLVFPDWIIAAKRAVGGMLYRQGLFLLGANEQPLPRGAAAFLEKSGLIITEVAEGAAQTLSAAPPPPPAILDLRGLTGIAFAEALLKGLNEAPERNVPIVVFEQAKDGFNLSITVDLLVRKGEKRYLIHTKRLPDQFVRILKEQGSETVFLRENAPRRALIEELLPRLDIPVSFGHFSFRIPEEGARPRLIATFPALRSTVGGEPLYLFDFDLSPDTTTLLQGRLKGRVAKY